jgi:hypothetical protein
MTKPLFMSERGIDIIREKISKFCSTISLEGGSEINININLGLFYCY